jgi:hypothetical protein
MRLTQGITYEPLVTPRRHEPADNIVIAASWEPGCSKGVYNCRSRDFWKLDQQPHWDG